jgi:hypothetical protein
MMHGLPKYLYPKGMFHLEVSGPAKISGTLILPSNSGRAFCASVVEAISLLATAGEALKGNHNLG